LLVHAVNTALLFATVWSFTRGARLACLGAAAWAVAPLNEGVLGWYTNFGQALLTIIILLVLARMGRYAREPQPPPLREVTVWAVLMLIGALTWGYGIGVAIAFPVIAVVMLGAARLTRTARAILFALAPVVLLLFASFGPRGGLLSTPVDAAIMMLHLVAFGSTSLVAGFWDWPLDYPSAIAYVIGMIVAVIACAGFALGSPSARRILLGVGLLLLASYGSVALGRGSMGRLMGDPSYSASSLRYHYVSTAMLAIAMCVALAQIGARLRVAAPWSDVLLWAWLGYAIVGYRYSGWTIDHFDAERRRVEAALQGMRAAVAQTPPDQPVFIVNQPFAPEFGVGTFPFFAGWASLYTIYFREPPGRPVYFIDRAAAKWCAALPNSALARAVVPLPESRPDEAMCPARIPLTCGG
jgi:hypothetical protein